MKDEDIIEIETTGCFGDSIKNLIGEYNNTQAVDGTPIEPEVQRAWIYERVNIDAFVNDPKTREYLVRAAIGRHQGQSCRSGVAYIVNAFAEGYFKPDMFDFHGSPLMIKASDGKYIPIRHLHWSDWDTFVESEKEKLHGKIATLTAMKTVSDLLKQALGNTKSLGQLADEMASAA